MRAGNRKFDQVDSGLPLVPGLHLFSSEAVDPASRDSGVPSRSAWPTRTRRKTRNCRAEVRARWWWHARAVTARL